MAWDGIVTLGLVVVGMTDILFGDSKKEDINAIITGDLLIIMAQIIVAIQMVYEQKYLEKYDVPALFAVGLEGLFRHDDPLNPHDSDVLHLRAGHFLHEPFPPPRGRDLRVPGDVQEPHDRRRPLGNRHQHRILQLRRRQRHQISRPPAAWSSTALGLSSSGPFLSLFSESKSLFPAPRLRSPQHRNVQFSTLS
ncbi:hypothetical protein L596_029550 [Steinernema carpocapsae]|uniref:Uncharacterized protein n=1 Tax=Steinernema carpocapsae TaxID=34508 RepID=A0A4U5LUY5_STECR|nr:hypothetical protein L596_029550 [Steinernema carpocapsae]